MINSFKQSYLARTTRHWCAFSQIAYAETVYRAYVNVCLSFSELGTSTVQR